jgi:DnaJ-domain-containing protein 1
MSADGLYLFLGGRVVSYHQGYNLTASLLELAAFIGTDGRVQVESDRHTQEILDLFAPAVAEFMRQRAARQARPSNASGSLEQKARETLGVSTGASATEIGQAWRRRRGEYSPDKVQHVSDPFFRLAHEKIHQIDEAYGLLRPRRRAGSRVRT